FNAAIKNRTKASKIMRKIFGNVCSIVAVWFLAVTGENITTENDNKYLNNFVNISNLPPELIEYYDSDGSQDAYTSSIPPEIYPDPESVQISKKIPSVDDYKSLINTNLVEKNEDFKEHDTIDNIMYIYYGSVGSMRKSLGGSIIIVGAVFALAAQILAIVLSLLRNRRFRRQNDLATISLNLLSTLCASNFVFIVGVQASKTLFKCEMIAILLHYFHLSTSLWGCCHTYTIYDFIINDNAPNLKYHNLVSYVGSAVYVLLSFIVSNASYETFDYCWMSVARGMIINFMIPISALIVTTTVL
ncbi:Cadherin EGF LAG seven-pass G-type receptor 1, partial [Pseudolycoriella hygida]